MIGEPCEDRGWRQVGWVSGERVMAIRRVISSLELLRFNALMLDSSQQAYVITGNAKEIAAMRSAAASMTAELGYLSDKRAELSLMKSQFALLDATVKKLIEQERMITDLRRTQGFDAARAVIKKDAAGRCPTPKTRALTAMASQVSTGFTAPRLPWINRHANHVNAVIKPHRRSTSSVMPP